MKAVSIVFPHQLFLENPCIDSSREIYLVEEYLFFRQYNFHQQKIMLHRASMKAYEDYLLSKKYTVTYIESHQKNADIQVLIRELASGKIEEIHFTDTVDNWLEKRINVSAKKNKLKLKKYDTPNFLNTKEDLDEYFNKKKKYFQTDFYIWQRKERNILLEENEKPIGGKWTYDAENRQKFPKNEKAPVITFPKENKYIQEAKAYVKKHFPDNYGQADEFKYPITYQDADKWLAEFIENRFSKFGIYEDAMVKDESVLYHSILTPMLNIGLLNPKQIIETTIQAAIDHGVPLNSLEGFIRQVMGWREFIRIVYEREGSKQRTTNYWKFKRKIPASFWEGSTGIHPIDTVIKRILKSGYCHHIERLMVLGNFMLLCEFDPDEVYRWFMEMFIDSYDWVMVPNVYGMTQFADGGLMTTKPYISGSNYLMKMGNWDKGDWQQTWDGLFWRFMDTHRDFFLLNPRLGMLIKTFDKMPAEKRNFHLKNANKFLTQLDNETKISQRK